MTINILKARRERRTQIALWEQKIERSKKYAEIIDRISKEGKSWEK